MTQDVFADTTQIKIKTISLIETGRRRMGIDTLSKLIVNLGVPAEFILFGHRFNKSRKNYSKIAPLIADCNAVEMGMLCDMIALWKSHLRANRHENK